jgi:hypothetical protein
MSKRNAILKPPSPTGTAKRQTLLPSSNARFIAAAGINDPTKEDKAYIDEIINDFDSSADYNRERATSMCKLNMNRKNTLFGEIKTFGDIQKHRGSVNLAMVSNSKFGESNEDGLYESTPFSEDLPVDIDEFIFIKKHKKFDKDTRDNFKLEEKKKIRNLE